LKVIPLLLGPDLYFIKIKFSIANNSLWKKVELLGKSLWIILSADPIHSSWLAKEVLTYLKKSI
jgi:hypothetical protein